MKTIIHRFSVIPRNVQLIQGLNLGPDQLQYQCSCGSTFVTPKSAIEARTEHIESFNKVDA